MEFGLLAQRAMYDQSNASSVSKRKRLMQCNSVLIYDLGGQNTGWQFEIAVVILQTCTSVRKSVMLMSRLKVNDIHTLRNN